MESNQKSEQLTLWIKSEKTKSKVFAFKRIFGSYSNYFLPPSPNPYTHGKEDGAAY